MSAIQQDDIVAARVLNAVYDAGGSMPYEALRAAVAATPRQIWRAVYAQHNLGTVWRHRAGEPIRLTVAARTAIAAMRLMAS